MKLRPNPLWSNPSSRNSVAVASALEIPPPLLTRDWTESLRRRNLILSSQVTWKPGWMHQRHPLDLPAAFPAAARANWRRNWVILIQRLLLWRRKRWTRSNQLLHSCPFFHNELGGDPEWCFFLFYNFNSLNIDIFFPLYFTGPSDSTYDVRVLEFPPATWDLPHQKQSWSSSRAPQLFWPFCRWNHPPRKACLFNKVLDVVSPEIHLPWLHPCTDHTQ